MLPAFGCVPWVRSRSSPEFWLPGPEVAQSEREMWDVVGTQFCAVAACEVDGPGWRAVGQPLAQAEARMPPSRLTNTALNMCFSRPRRPAAADS
jgi:hypothetical protein